MKASDAKEVDRMFRVLELQLQGRLPRTKQQWDQFQAWKDGEKELALLLKEAGAP